MDRSGAEYKPILNDIRKKLGLKSCSLQVPIGHEDKFIGVIDIIKNRCVYFEGTSGKDRKFDIIIPPKLMDEVLERRNELYKIHAA